VALILRCRFKSNGSAKIVVQAIEEVTMLQVRHEDWAGRLYYARSRVSNEQTRQTITAFRAALWAGGGNPPGIIDHLANEKKKGCICSVQ